MKLSKLDKWLIAGIVVMFLSMWFLYIYGEKTACKNVAVYVKCYEF